MQRINVTTLDVDDDGRAYVRLVGWFNAHAAERFGQGQDQAYDEFRGQTLWHTAGGRWVLQRWSRWQGERTTWEYIGSGAARDWLILNDHDEAIERLFGAPPEPEHGPDHPEIGAKVEVEMPPEMLAALHAEAEREGMTHAAMIRRLIAEALPAA